MPGQRLDEAVKRAHLTVVPMPQAPGHPPVRGNQNCANCKFWHHPRNYIQSQGVCRRRAEYVNRAEDEWCGEWEWEWT